MRGAAGVILLVAVECLTFVSAAQAAPTAAEAADAKRHYGQGSRYYDLAEYEDALREFKEAYRVVDDPAFLFNIAQCHRKLGHGQDAITFYRTYLRRAPNTPNRAEVERLIAEIERTEAARPEAAPAPAPAPVPSAIPPSTPVPPAPVPAAAPLVVASPDRPGGEADAGRPFYKSPWFWVVAGAVLVGAAVTTIVIVQPGSEPTRFCPDCTTTAAIDPR